jgi:transcription factor IIIB subunit 2
MEFNKDWMEQTLKKQLKLEHDQKMGVPIREPYKRKKPKAPRDASTAMHTSSAAESAKMMLKQKQFSKKINYDALNNLFPGAKQVGGSSKGRGGRKGERKRRRQESSDESSSEDERGKRQRGKYFGSGDEAQVVEEDGDVLPPSHPLRRNETRLNRRGHSSAAEESGGATDLGDEVDEWADEGALDVNADMNADMRRKLGYFVEQDDDEGEEID